MEHRQINKVEHRQINMVKHRQINMVKHRQIDTVEHRQIDTVEHRQINTLYTTNFHSTHEMSLWCEIVEVVITAAPFLVPTLKPMPHGR